jgi:hypothetical protein
MTAEQEKARSGAWRFCLKTGSRLRGVWVQQGSHPVEAGPAGRRSMRVRCCTLTVARSWLNGWLSVEKIGAGQRVGASAWCPRQDSNLRTALRRRVLYPLSYGGLRSS